MIIARAPVRIELGGGGTDIPSYYTKYQGFLLSGAINKYIYVIINPSFENIIRLGYIVDTEICKHVHQVKDNLTRESFKLLGIKGGLEVVSLADVPSGTGLGSSGAFISCLLRALHAYKGEKVSRRQLAEEACKIEIEILKAPVGKQDQYAAVFGGLVNFAIGKNGKVKVVKIKMKPTILKRFENNLLLFYTGRQRSSTEILKEEDEKNKQGGKQNIKALHDFKKIAHKVHKSLLSGNIDDFGRFLGQHWEAKKKLSSKVTNSFFDECYELALRNGALGGMIMGAGGGGFFLFYHPGRDKTRLVRLLERKGYKHLPFGLDFAGTKIVASE